MHLQKTSLLALVLAIVALGLQIRNSLMFHEQVTKIVAEREKEYCRKLAVKLNEARELMGLEPEAPTNFAEVLTSYFESMAAVMNAGVANSPKGKEKAK
jgi:hypothetical protein